MTAQKLLPAEARLRLIKAAQTPNTDRDPNAREKAIDEAVAWSRLRYPDHFRWSRQQGSQIAPAFDSADSGLALA